MTEEEGYGQNVESWDQAYKVGETPWDMGKSDSTLVSLIETGAIVPCDVLDVGCGTGNDAIYLSKARYRVTGVDLARTAIQTANRKALQAGASCQFLVANALDLPFPSNTFDLVLDKACFHFIPASERQTYINNIKRVLRQGGQFLLFVASDHDTEVSGSFHKFTKQEITDTFGRDFKILTIRLVTLESHGLKPHPYFCIMSKES